MARPYCTQEEVKRFLRTANKKIRTSEAYKGLGYNSGNLGTVRLSAVSFHDSYQGHERFEVTFSDATSFEVSGEDIGYLGQGTTDQTCSVVYFSLLPFQWSGIAQATDVVFFESDSDISNDDLDSFIDDSGDYIRNRLGPLFGDSTNIPWEQDWSIAIPDGLGFASILLTSYYIYRTAIAGTEIDQEAPIKDWKREADELIKYFIEWYSTEGQISAPSWRSREVLFTEIGITGQGEGVIDVTTDTSDGTSFKRN